MRLWHYELIPVLPQNILIRLWHDCEAIGSNLERKGVTGDVKCDRILDYHWREFEEYCTRVHNTMILSRYNVNSKLAQLLFNRIKGATDRFYPDFIWDGSVYKKWHDLDYFDLCYKLIKELHDCNVIKDDDWFRFNDDYHHKRIGYVSSMLSRPATDSTVHDRDRYDAIIDSASAIYRSQTGLYIDATGITDSSIIAAPLSLSIDTPIESDITLTSYNDFLF